MNRLDERLKERARREDCPIPQGFDGRMDAILEGLPEGRRKPGPRRLRRWVVAGVLAAALCVGAVVAIGAGLGSGAFDPSGFLGAGIILQVVRVVELRRVDEDADDRAIALRAAFLHQRKMPLVQGSHRRDEACPPGSASHFARQFRVFRKDFHRVLSYAFGVFFDMAKVEIRL